MTHMCPHVCAPLRLAAPQLSVVCSPKRPKRVPVEGHALLCEEEVQELEEQGGIAALKQAYLWLYGKPVQSGNTTWLRKALCST